MVLFLEGLNERGIGVTLPHQEVQRWRLGTRTQAQHRCEQGRKTRPMLPIHFPSKNSGFPAIDQLELQLERRWSVDPQKPGFFAPRILPPMRRRTFKIETIARF